MGHVAHVGENGLCIQIFGRKKPEGTWPLARPSHRWHVNIVMYLSINGIGGRGLDTFF